MEVNGGQYKNNAWILVIDPYGHRKCGEVSGKI